MGLADTVPFLVILDVNSSHLCQFGDSAPEGDPPWAICRRCLVFAKEILEGAGASYVEFEVTE